MLHSNLKKPIFPERSSQWPHGFDQKRKERRILSKKLANEAATVHDQIVLLQNAQLRRHIPIRANLLTRIALRKNTCAKPAHVKSYSAWRQIQLVFKNTQIE